jgi:hypothetical protein
MAAGLGFKDFTTGEVLTAADVDGYLMQGIWVFASTAARDAAVTSPQEGNFAFTKDTNSLWYYDGAAWVASGATGDIEGVTAGIGISGGGTSGTVTVTNSMATAIDAKGDLVAGTGADTFAKLTVGANNTVLTADSAEATGLKWATASSGGMTLINSGGTTLTGASVTISSIPATYKNLFIVVRNFLPSNDDEGCYIRFNGDSTGNRWYVTASINLTNTSYDGSNGALIPGNDNGTSQGLTTALVHDYSNSTTWKMITTDSLVNNGTTNTNLNYRRYINIYNQTAAVSSITLFVGNGTFTSGTAFLYGVS